MQARQPGVRYAFQASTNWLCDHGQTLVYRAHNSNRAVLDSVTILSIKFSKSRPSYFCHDIQNEHLAASVSIWRSFTWWLLLEGKGQHWAKASVSVRADPLIWNYLWQSQVKGLAWFQHLKQCWAIPYRMWAYLKFSECALSKEEMRKAHLIMDLSLYALMCFFSWEGGDKRVGQNIPA